MECGAGPQVCALCNITTTSAEHMALHLRGKAHLRKQKIAEIQARQVQAALTYPVRFAEIRMESNIVVISRPLELWSIFAERV